MFNFRLLISAIVLVCLDAIYLNLFKNYLNIFLFLNHNLACLFLIKLITSSMWFPSKKNPADAKYCFLSISTYAFLDAAALHLYDLLIVLPILSKIISQ